MTNVKERILYFIENQKFNKEDFFKKIELSYSNFKGIQKKSALSSDAMAKILTIYPIISADWLLTGKGEMLKDISSSKNVDQVNESETFYSKEPTLLAAQQKTISILETVVIELRTDVVELRNDKKLLVDVLKRQLYDRNQKEKQK